MIFTNLWYLYQILTNMNNSSSQFHPKCKGALHTKNVWWIFFTLSTIQPITATLFEVMETMNWLNEYWECFGNAKKTWNSVQQTWTTLLLFAHIRTTTHLTAFYPRWPGWPGTRTRKPRKGAAVIAASMHGFASCRKFKSPVTLTLTLDRVKVISTYAVYVGLPAYPTMWL